MKKIKKYLYVLIIILLTGCSNYDMSMKIGKDKSMEYVLTILSNYKNNNLTNNISAYKEKYEQYGYSVEEYALDNKYGIIISKRFDDIDKISYGKRKDEFDLPYLYKDGYNKEVENKMFNVDKGILTNRYAANFYVDLSNLGINLNNATVTFKVEVPNGTVSDNATSKSEDNNTLIWNITSLGKSEIDFVFELRSYDYLYYGIAIFIIIYLFFSILSGLSNKDDDKETIRNGYNNYTGDNIDKKIENLTNNAIRNSSNKNITVTKPNLDNKLNQVKTIKPIQASGKIEPKKNDDVPKDDITTLQMPTKQKKKGFSIFGNKNNSSENNNKQINNNEEFNTMIKSLNNNENSKEDTSSSSGEINALNSVAVNNLKQDENNPITNVNMNSGSENSIMDWYDTPSVKSNVNELNTDVSASDKEVTTENNKIETDTEIKLDIPVIRVNNKTITVNDDKKDE